MEGSSFSKYTTGVGLVRTFDFLRVEAEVVRRYRNTLAHKLTLGHAGSTCPESQAVSGKCNNVQRTTFGTVTRSVSESGLLVRGRLYSERNRQSRWIIQFEQ
jgi:hypothetical protein